MDVGSRILLFNLLAEALSDGVEVPLKETVAALAEGGLRQRWLPNAKKPIRPTTLASLLTLYFNHSEDPSDTLDTMVRSVMHNMLVLAVSVRRRRRKNIRGMKPIFLHPLSSCPVPAGRGRRRWCQGTRSHF